MPNPKPKTQRKARKPDTINERLRGLFNAAGSAHSQLFAQGHDGWAHCKCELAEQLRLTSDLLYKQLRARAQRRKG